MEKLALTVAEAVELGGPCRSGIYEDINEGRLRAVKRGRSTRILVDDFKKYLAALPAIVPSKRPTDDGELPPKQSLQHLDSESINPISERDQAGPANIKSASRRARKSPVLPMPHIARNQQRNKTETAQRGEPYHSASHETEPAVGGRRRVMAQR